MGAHALLVFQLLPGRYLRRDGSGSGHPLREKNDEYELASCITTLSGYTGGAGDSGDHTISTTSYNSTSNR